MADVPRPRVVILGCVHAVQVPLGPYDYWKTKSADFSKAIEKIVAEYQVQFIGEEFKHGIDTHAAVIAREQKIPHEIIDIPQLVQDQIKLHPRCGPHPLTKRTTDFEKEQNRYVVAWDSVREYHMYKAFLEALGKHDPSLLICGNGHVEGFKALLSADFQVVTKEFEIDGEGKSRFME